MPNPLTASLHRLTWNVFASPVSPELPADPPETATTPQSIELQPFGATHATIAPRQSTSWDRVKAGALAVKGLVDKPMGIGPTFGTANVCVMNAAAGALAAQAVVSGLTQGPMGETVGCAVAAVAAVAIGAEHLHAGVELDYRRLALGAAAIGGFTAAAGCTMLMNSGVRGQGFPLSSAGEVLVGLPSSAGGIFAVAGVMSARARTPAAEATAA